MSILIISSASDLLGNVLGHVHVMFANGAVDHQFLVYEENGHFSKMVSVNTMGGISIYRLPFWHYTTPLVGKKGREAEARRWLLLGSFEILS